MAKCLFEHSTQTVIAYNTLQGSGSHILAVERKSAEERRPEGNGDIAVKGRTLNDRQMKLSDRRPKDFRPVRKNAVAHYEDFCEA